MHICWSLSRYKYWNCCCIRTTDFNAFLDQKGCTTGKHCWIHKQVTFDQWIVIYMDTTLSVICMLCWCLVCRTKRRWLAGMIGTRQENRSWSQSTPRTPVQSIPTWRQTARWCVQINTPASSDFINKFVSLSVNTCFFVSTNLQLTCHIQFEGNKVFHKDIHLWGVRLLYIHSLLWYNLLKLRK